MSLRSAPQARCPQKSLSGRESGFTIPELISVMVVTVILSGLIMYFAFQFWRSSASLSSSLEAFVGRLTSGDRLRDALNVSSGLITQNSLEDSNTGAPDPAIGSGLFWEPLHATPGTKAMGASGTITPVFYFKGPSVDTSKNIVLNGTQPYEDEFVLYLDGTTKELRMRILANPDAPDNRLATTCPPAAVTSTCPIDRLMGSNLASVELRYFDRSRNIIDCNSIIDPDTGECVGPDFPVAEAVELVLNTFKKSQLHGGADTTSETIIRVAIRNT